MRPQKKETRKRGSIMRSSRRFSPPVAVNRPTFAPTALVVLVLRPVVAVAVLRAALELQDLQPARDGLRDLLAQLLGARVRIEQAVAQEGEQVLELTRRQIRDRRARRCRAPDGRGPAG